MYVRWDANDRSENVDPPYTVYGGLFQQDAIMLLRRFYIQENGNGMDHLKVLETGLSLTDDDTAPEPKSKKNRELKYDFPAETEVRFAGSSWQKNA